MDWIWNLNLHMLLTDMLDLSMAFLLIFHFFHHPMLSLTLVLQGVLALLPGDLLCDGVAALVQLGPALLLYLGSLFRYLEGCTLRLKLLLTHLSAPGLVPICFTSELPPSWKSLPLNLPTHTFTPLPRPSFHIKLFILLQYQLS